MIKDVVNAEKTGWIRRLRLKRDLREDEGVAVLCCKGGGRTSISQESRRLQRYRRRATLERVETYARPTGVRYIAANTFSRLLIKQALDAKESHISALKDKVISQPIEAVKNLSSHGDKIIRTAGGSEDMDDLRREVGGLKAEKEPSRSRA